MSHRITHRSLILSLLFCPTAVSAQIPQQAKQYLDRAFGLMESSALYRKQVDLSALRHEAERYAAGAQETWDAYPAIVYACAQRHNGLCYLILPASTPKNIEERCRELTATYRRRGDAVPLIKMRRPPLFSSGFLYLTLLHNGRKYGYVAIPDIEPRGRNFRDVNERHAWAETLSRIISRGAAEQVEGWILDLRGNSGGYLAPMLAGVQSLLGEGSVLITRRPGGKGDYSVRGGKVIRHIHNRPDHVEERIDEPVSYSKEALPVVLLHNGATAGAAESFLTAVKGRKNTAFVGTRTGGYVLNGTYWDLSDGATLWIAEDEVLDRNGQAYPEGLEPDFEVDDPAAAKRIEGDPVVLKAEEWLAERSPK